MSRIGKLPVAVPPKVKVEVKGQKILVEGPKGKLDWELPRRTSLKVENGERGGVVATMVLPFRAVLEAHAAHGSAG